MNRIEKKIVNCIKQMENACLEIPLEKKEYYAQWIAQTFFYVRNATRVLAKASFRCNFEEEDLHKKFLMGINEEKNHEILAVNDLEACGYSIKQFREFSETSAYYQSLFHLLDTKGPYILLGYFVTLEGLGAIGSHKIYDRIVGAHNEKACSFVKVHAKLDDDHYSEGIKYLNKLDSKALEIVEYGVDISTELYCNMIRRIAAEPFAQKKTNSDQQAHMAS